jgi:hypothetical protein
MRIRFRRYVLVYVRGLPCHKHVAFTRVGGQLESIRQCYCVQSKVFSYSTLREFLSRIFEVQAADSASAVELLDPIDSFSRSILFGKYSSTPYSAR